MLSISIDKWLVVPLPLEATFICPGRFLASSINSLTVFTGTLGCVVNTSGTEDIQLTGARSFTGSKEIFL
jgi:hypothetical protein